MESELIYVNTRATPGPKRLAGYDVTVSARTADHKLVLLQWQRSDRAAEHRPPAEMVLTADELRGIVSALDETGGGDD